MCKNHLAAIWKGGNCGKLVAAGYRLPEKWQPGMKVKVRWNRPIKGKDNWIEKYTTILHLTMKQAFYTFISLKMTKSV
ncbi:DUF3304 domain-containing protein [Janthinobacterium sp. B9-8]|uniref:DUF3304 domain-containing protein n=1 Tax=Janthinobacterium sp. B9-8 TaxID=1236179 RepID=UPI003FA54C8B